MLTYAIWVVYLLVLFITFFLLIVLLEEGGIREPVEHLDEWPSVTLAIPAYNEEDTIGMTIESALDVDYPEDKLDIIVVNDGSEDSTREAAEQYADSDQVTLINQENQGKGGALNTALERAASELFGCVDADSYLPEESIKNIVSEMDDDAGGIASAMKVYRPGNLLQKLQWAEYMVGIFLRNLMASIDAINVTPGPLSIYRKDILDSTGGFDEESLVEDQEICFRLQRHDATVSHSRTGEVYTVAPSTLKAFYNQRLRWFKGSVENVLKYREMFLNPRYGDFGMFAVPVWILQGVLSVVGLFILSYYFLEPMYAFLRTIVLYGMPYLDIPELTLSTVHWFLLGVDWITVTFLGTLIFFSVFLFYLSARHTEEDPLQHGVSTPFIYVLWYFLAVGFMWGVSFVSVFLDIALGREKR